MKRIVFSAFTTGVAGLLAGCMEVPANDGLSGSTTQFDSMEQPCRTQAARLTGVPKGAIIVTDRLRTGGGPLLTLSAAGMNYSCRLEDNGSVTVFSEFAN